MSAPLALTLFHRLCEVGNALERYRDLFAPADPTWVALTDMLLAVDSAVEMLLYSEGLDDDVDA